MEKIRTQAMRTAGITCFIVLALIGIMAFVLPSQTLIDYLTFIGELVGQGTTVGVFIVAALPPLSGAMMYYFWRWVLK